MMVLCETIVLFVVLCKFLSGCLCDLFVIRFENYRDYSCHSTLQWKWFDNAWNLKLGFRNVSTDLFSFQN